MVACCYLNADLIGNLGYNNSELGNMILVYTDYEPFGEAIHKSLKSSLQITTHSQSQLGTND